MEIFKKAKNILLKTKNNFLKFFLNKRFATLLLLFFVISGLVLPNISHADVLPSWFCKIAQFSPQGYLFGCGTIIGSKIGLDAAAKNLFNAIISAVGQIPISISMGLSRIAIEIFEKSTDDSNFFSYTKFDNPVISTGWPIARDLANMFIVLGFVVVGLATILRFHDYEAKKLLPKLIIAALLINFSLVICGVFIDFSNIVMKYFSNPGNNLQKSWFGSTFDMIVEVGKTDWSSDSGWFDGISNVAGLLLQNFIAIFIFILYAFLFIGRRIALWILVVLSPLSFVCYVFPFTKNFWNKWWNNFFAWCIIGIGGSFFIYIGNQIAQKFQTDTPSGDILVFFVPGIFLIMGFLFSLQTSAMGASMITSRASGVWNKYNPGKFLSKTASAGKELLGRTQRAQRFNEMYGRAKSWVAESTGFAKRGTYSKQEKERGADARKQLEAMRTSSLQSDRNRYEDYVRTGTGAMGAEAVALANEKGDLSKLMSGNINNINARVNLATQYGYERGDFEKKNYRLKQFDNDLMDRAIGDQGVLPPGANAQERVNNARIMYGAEYDEAARIIRTRQLADNLSKMSPEEIMAIDDRDVGGPNNYDFVSNNFTPKMIEQLQLAPSGIRTAMRGHLGQLNADISRASGGELTRLEKIRDAINLYC